MAEEEEEQSPEREWASGTTLHGPAKVVDAPNWVVRILWLLLFLFSLGYATYLIATSLIDFLSWGTVTDVKLEFTDQLEFPAVTICNFNKFEKDLLCMDQRAVEYLRPLIGNDTICEYDNSTSTGPTYYPMTLAGITAYTGFQMDRYALKECTWRGETCTWQNFTHVFGEYGNCYVFNQKTSGEPLQQTIPGQGNGLHMVLDVHEAFYTENPDTGGTTDVGVKVHIHPQGEPAKMDIQGIPIGPGSHAYIGISQVTYQNEIPPWGLCKDLDLEYYDTYTLTGCLMECMAHWVERECGCTALELPGNLSYCEPQQIVDCVLGVKDQIITGALPCDCPTPCRIQTFDYFVSYAGWPNHIVEVYLGEENNVDMAYMQSNWVSIDVFYEELNFEQITQKKAMTPGDLLSGLGGQLGLFVGASVITIMEFLEYLLKRLTYCCRKKKKTNKVSASTCQSQVWTADKIDPLSLQKVNMLQETKMYKE
ncbi:ASIC5 [Branchiostoma lanceolatum]|uniref:ASIC5 protein n=1 Tax=Branchiostoma lanceolatum TaxID=7740 RepID=A0A8J9ZI26_BRALA|nr:ASIC5 [Branchiostoma lanceolatum]